MPRQAFAAISFLLCLLISAGVAAAERKAYKIVDEKGNVTYSQTPPPAAAKSVQKVDISPASTGRGGYPGSYRDSRETQYQPSREYADERARQQEEMRKQRQQAEEQRIANLKAECMRNRGADCENPETLRLIEAQRIPGGRSYR